MARFLMISEEFWASRCRGDDAGGGDGGNGDGDGGDGGDGGGGDDGFLNLATVAEFCGVYDLPCGPLINL